MISALRTFISNQHFRTVGFIFAVNSLMFGSWITRLPEVQNRLGLSEGELGLALLGVPLGSITIMPFMGWIIHKLGDGKTTLISALIFCIISTFPILAPTYLTLILSLVLVGLTTGTMDIAMNASAAAVEKKHSKLIMATCHGMWSVGSMVGASTTSVFIGLGIKGPVHIILLGVLLLIYVITQIPVLLSIREETVSDTFFSLPSGPLIGLAVIGFCVMLGEGAIADWSAVYLKNTLKANAFYTGMGYAGFSLSMAVGRFYGDKIIAAFGTRILVTAGSIIGIIGLSAGLLIGDPLAVVIGFTFAGIGFSCLVPALYISASRTPGRLSGASIAAVAGLGYFGMFIGPPLIGFVAEAFGLTIGLSLVIILLAFSFLLSLRTPFHS